MQSIDPRSTRAFDFYCQSRRWRGLPADALAQLILETRRRAAHQHLTPGEWHELDLMRRRLRRLQEAVQWS
jgi:hypothetical protein